MTFRRRDYPEVLDNLLTGAIAGVAAEAHPFPGPGTGLEHHLEQPPAATVVSIYGLRNGVSGQFRPETDFRLLDDGRTVVWNKDGLRPDEGTLVHVNYLRRDTLPRLTDLQVGSIARTLLESTAMEIARVYAQLQAVDDAAHIETATGGALDKVVALLGIARIPADRPTASVRFQRTSGSSGVITIAAGTRIIDADAEVEYETLETVTLAENQQFVTVLARDLEPANDPVAAGTLSILTVPISGIAAVSNPASASRAAAAESDQQLRTRARNFLHGSERATLGSLRHVMAQHQVPADVEEAAQPGLVIITPHTESISPERLERIRFDLEAARPAGVTVRLELPVAPLDVDLEIRLVTDDRASEAQLRRAHEQVRARISDFFRALPVRENARVNQLVSSILSVERVLDLTLISAQVNGEDRLNRNDGVIDIADAPTVLGELLLADRNLPTEVDVVISLPDPAALDRSLTQQSLEGVIAYWNTLVDTATPSDDPLDVQRHTVSLGKFLLVLPAPAGSGLSLAAFDATDPTGPLPPLAALAPLQVAVTITPTDGLTTVLSDDGGSYILGEGERLTLTSLTVTG